jgi:hypothetical protein
MKSHVASVTGVLVSAISCGATFMFALYRQLALVEVAANLLVGVQLYFLSSSIGDGTEKKIEPSRWRVWIAMGWRDVCCAIFWWREL